MDFYRFLPSYWFQNTKTDLEWDGLLNKALDKYPVVTGYLTVNVGPLEVWVGNWPYAYGSLRKPVQREGLPAVATRKRLRALVKKEDYTEVERAIS